MKHEALVSQLVGAQVQASAQMEYAVDRFAFVCIDVFGAELFEEWRQFPLHLEAKARFLSSTCNKSPLKGVEKAKPFRGDQFLGDFNEYSRIRNALCHGKITGVDFRGSLAKLKYRRIFPPQKDPSNPRGVKWITLRDEQLLIEDVGASIDFFANVAVACDRLRSECEKRLSTWPSAKFPEVTSHYDPQRAFRSAKTYLQ